MAKYLGPAATLTYNGHVYLPGDNVPMPKAQMEQMAARGHQFEDVDPPGGPDRRTAMPVDPTPPPTMRFDDRGQGHVVERKAKAESAKTDAAK